MSEKCDCVASAAEGACFELCPLHASAPAMREALKKICNIDMRFDTPLTKDQSEIFEAVAKHQRDIRDIALKSAGEDGE